MRGWSGFAGAEACQSSASLSCAATNPIGDYLAIKRKCYWRCPPVENNWQDAVDAVDCGRLW